jgi:hypothetical protein
MKKSWQETFSEYLVAPRPIKLVNSQCETSPEDLKEFGVCLCGCGSIPPQVKSSPSISFAVDTSGSMTDEDFDLFKEFLELIGEIPKKP